MGAEGAPPGPRRQTQPSTSGLDTAACPFVMLPLLQIHAPVRPVLEFEFKALGHNAANPPHAN